MYSVKERGRIGASLIGLAILTPCATGAVDYRVPLVPSASDSFRQGFVRVVNHGAQTGEVRIEASDDDGNAYGPVTLSLSGHQARHFNSVDLENGSPEKGFPIGVGTGNGSWRLELSSELDVEVLAYIRTEDGFLTAMHDVVRATATRHRVPVFNPASNVNQRSQLRIINPTYEPVNVSITGTDDAGVSPAGTVTATIAARASRTLTASQLERGDTAIDGALGDGTGKWRLSVESESPVIVMSLMMTPTGHLSNLSTATGNRSSGEASFRDPLTTGGSGPEMVVVPAGTFSMGCMDDECNDDELPVHDVTIEESFAMSKFEVTFAQWDACVEDSWCEDEVDDRGWGRGERPVIGMSWHGAKDYVEWLSRRTGETYRLPSEAEWEYAARAGTTTKYSWGDEIGVDRANCQGCGGRWDARNRTAPVGSFPANPWGLHDMHGNVFEWVEDCETDNYEGAPLNGEAWMAGDCTRRGIRDGGYLYGPSWLRVAGRGSSVADDMVHEVGFRAVRKLTP